MFEKLFNLPSAVREHQTAPLAQEREAFLAYLVHELSVRARAAYVQAGNTEQSAASGLAYHNELVNDASGHLRDSLTSSPSFPDDVFVDSLIFTAEA